MDKYKKLNIERGIFAFIIFVIFGVILCTEKAGSLLSPKIKEIIDEYITENYASIKESTLQEEITYKDRKFTMKVYDRKNKNHYFYITYSNGKITDTYEEDYLKGKSILNEITKELEKEIYNKTKIKVKVNILSNLDEYTSKVQELILKEHNLSSTKIYSLNINLDIKPWNATNISLIITNTLNKFIDKNINPKSYNITINNLDEITESIEIKNINNNFVDNENKEQIINDIINNENSNLLKTNKITYKYLN